MTRSSLVGSLTVLGMGLSIFSRVWAIEGLEDCGCGNWRVEHSEWKSFGRTPNAYIGKNSERADEDFDEIYWRMRLRLAPDWVGGVAAPN